MLNQKEMSSFRCSKKLKERQLLTRRQRLKSALYLRLKKRKVFKIVDFQKNLKISKIFFFRKMSHSAEKCKRGDPFDFQTCILLQNNKKLKGGPFGDIKKFSKKSHTVPKKIRRGTL